MYFFKIFVKFFFFLKGFKVVGNIPKGINKAVLVFAPHTSAWDAFYGIGTFYLSGIPIKFTIKKSFMFFPFGFFLSKLGAIPVDKYKIKRRGMTLIDSVVNLFNSHEKLYVLLEPEGTRAYNSKWHMGFYKIATIAKVPIILTYIDYDKMEGGYGPVFYPTGDIDLDLLKIKDFYKTIRGKYPENGVR